MPFPPKLLGPQSRPNCLISRQLLATYFHKEASLVSEHRENHLQINPNRIPGHSLRF